VALERLNRKAIVSEESMKYYRRQRALRRWRASGSPSIDPKDDGLLKPPQPLWFLAAQFKLKSPSDIKPVKLRVRCSGTLHDVTVMPCGRITFHGHTKQDLGALRTLRSLGDETCGCLNLIKRVRESPMWRGKDAIIIKSTQQTRVLRNATQHSLRPGPMQEDRSKVARLHRIQSRVLNEASRLSRNQYEDVGRDDRRFGIADENHPAGVWVRVPQRFEVGKGWSERGKPELLVVLPLQWSLRLADRPQTGVIAGAFVFGMRFRTKTGGIARVAVRTGLTTFEFQHREVERTAGNPWKFTEPLNEWRP
jgi:hypothetical protein